MKIEDNAKISGILGGLKVGLAESTGYELNKERVQSFINLIERAESILKAERTEEPRFPRIYRPQPIYNISRDVDIEVEPDERGWHGINAMEADGNTLEELLESATYFSCDQDGGESYQYELESLNSAAYKSEMEAIKEEFLRLKAEWESKDEK